jgi:multidrug efflux pump
LSIAYDATLFIQASIDEVIKTLGEAVLIVIVVVFLFLGALRSVVIPVVTIPLSMIGVLFFMQMMGYSLNLLTLLAMVLAIGLVVDDAIVVVENIHRHIEEGKTPFDAALEGARDRHAGGVDDHHPGGRVRADRLPHRADRGLVQGVRPDPGRGGDHFRHRRPDPVADDVRPAAAPRAEPSGLAHRLDLMFERLKVRYQRCCTAPSTAGRWCWCSP